MSGNNAGANETDRNIEIWKIKRVRDQCACREFIKGLGAGRKKWGWGPGIVIVS